MTDQQIMVNRQDILLFDKMNAVELKYMFGRSLKETAKNNLSKNV